MAEWSEDAAVPRWSAPGGWVLECLADGDWWLSGPDARALIARPLPEVLEVASLIVEGDPLLSAAEVAQVLGWREPGTWRSAVAAGRAPRPDDPDEGRPAQRRSPRWRRSVVETYRAVRPGRGRRGLVSGEQVRQLLGYDGPGRN